jgi:predicted DNA-binding transcriptional regulator AlpA
MQVQQLDRFIDEKERRQLTTLSRSSWWRLERSGAVPKRRRIAPNRTAWLLSEIKEWMETQTRAA